MKRLLAMATAGVFLLSLEGARAQKEVEPPPVPPMLESPRPLEVPETKEPAAPKKSEEGKAKAQKAKAGKKSAQKARAGKKFAQKAKKSDNKKKTARVKKKKAQKAAKKKHPAAEPQAFQEEGPDEG
jgi:hypothetical protein